MTMTVHAHPRSAARHQAVHRGAVGARSKRSGMQVDAELHAGDVRLTMGGEPTFVSIDDRDGAEWNTAALGPTKRALAGELLQRLRDRVRARRLAAFRPGQVVSGRAAAALGARLLLAHATASRSGTTRPLIADENDDYGARRRAARAVPGRRWPQRLRRRSPQSSFAGLRGRLLLPVARAPAAGRMSIRSTRSWTITLERDAAGARLRAGARRSRRLRAAARATTTATGSCAGRAAVVPARRALFLVPGDSPMGYRLPLDSLPWVTQAECPWIYPPDPTVELPPLPDATGAAAGEGRLAAARGRADRARRTATSTDPRIARAVASEPTAPAPVESAGIGSRAPRCASSRATACCTSSCRRWSGSRTTSSWSPRSKPRPRELQHAGACSRATRRRAIRACSMLQRHARSGRDRGQHPAGRTAGTSWSSSTDVPLRGGAPDAAGDREVHARRPAHRHRRRQPRRARRRDAGRQPVPAPARPAAQPDRATGTIIRRCRTCSRACSSARPARRRASTRRATTRSTSWRSRSQQMPEAGDDGDCRPGWSTALLRNLLVDVTGNTHRAEFCIDKLYSPDGRDRPPRPARAARLRDAAARAHEPGAAAAAARAGRAVLERRRTRAPLVALGHRAARPLHAAALRRAGLRRRASTSCAAPAIRFEPSWFAPHFEFRFPLVGEFAATRRRAGAAPGARALARAGRGRRGRRHGALRRFVGRAPAGARCSGLTDERHVRHLQRPARAAAADRHASASSSPACATAPGSRRRRCIRPSASHAPLVFDLVDTWMERSMGGCPYHVAHPGGRSYDDVPGQRLRGREPAPGALLPHGPHARAPCRCRRRRRTPSSRSRSTCGAPHSLTLCLTQRGPFAGHMAEPLLDRYAPSRALRRAARRARASRAPHWRTPSCTRSPAASRRDGRATRCALTRARRSAKTASPTTSTPTRRAPTAPWELDPLPLVLAPEEWAAHRGRRRAARRPAQPRAGRPLRPAAAAARAARAAGGGASATAASCARCRASGRRAACTCSSLRGRPGARARRPLVGRRRPHAGAVGRRLRAGEPAASCRACFRSCSASCTVQRLAPFFDTLRDSLLHWAPRGDGQPLVVLLTPGPYNETYFEHAYWRATSASPLVEGSDLTVRDGTRLPEDARRPAAGARDPAPARRRLLRPAGAARRLGARRAGPADCARARHGAGGQRARLRRARVGRACSASCRAGRAAARRGAAAAVGGDLVVRRAGGAARRLAATSTSWSSSRSTRSAGERGGVRRRPRRPTQRAALRARVAARPQRYVAQEWVRVSQAPVLDREPATGWAASARAHRRPARVRGGHAERLPRDAGRPDARRRRRRCARHRHAARRPLEGHLGAVRRAGQRRRSRCCRPPSARRPGHLARQRAVARGREPVLVRPLRRALRRRGAAAARGASPPCWATRRPRRRRPAAGAGAGRAAAA